MLTVLVHALITLVNAANKGSKTQNPLNIGSPIQLSGTTYSQSGLDEFYKQAMEKMRKQEKINITPLVQRVQTPTPEGVQIPKPEEPVKTLAGEKQDIYSSLSFLDRYEETRTPDSKRRKIYLEELESLDLLIGKYVSLNRHLSYYSDINCLSDIVKLIATRLLREKGKFAFTDPYIASNQSPDIVHEWSRVLARALNYIGQNRLVFNDAYQSHVQIKGDSWEATVEQCLKRDIAPAVTACITNYGPLLKLVSRVKRFRDSIIQDLLLELFGQYECYNELVEFYRTFYEQVSTYRHSCPTEDQKDDKSTSIGIKHKGASLKKLLSKRKGNENEHQELLTIFKRTKAVLRKIDGLKVDSSLHILKSYLFYSHVNDFFDETAKVLFKIINQNNFPSDLFISSFIRMQEKHRIYARVAKLNLKAPTCSPPENVTRALTVEGDLNGASKIKEVRVQSLQEPTTGQDPIGANRRVASMPNTSSIFEVFTARGIPEYPLKDNKATMISNIHELGSTAGSNVGDAKASDSNSKAIEGAVALRGRTDVSQSTMLTHTFYTAVNTEGIEYLDQQSRFLEALDDSAFGTGVSSFVYNGEELLPTDSFANYHSSFMNLCSMASYVKSYMEIASFIHSNTSKNARDEFEKADINTLMPILSEYARVFGLLETFQYDAISSFPNEDILEEVGKLVMAAERKEKGEKGNFILPDMFLEGLRELIPGQGPRKVIQMAERQLSLVFSVIGANQKCDISLWAMRRSFEQEVIDKDIDSKYKTSCANIIAIKFIYAFNIELSVHIYRYKSLIRALLQLLPEVSDLVKN